MNDNKHLTPFLRKEIEKGLEAEKSFKAIGRETGKDCTTISKEIRARRVFKRTGAYGRPFNDCLNRRDCTQTKLCGSPDCRMKKCWQCKFCHLHCPEYVVERCQIPNRPPYVCNGCKNKSGCTLEKTLYFAHDAQKDYQEVLSEAHSGISIGVEDIERIEALAKPLVLKGQSIHSICARHRNEIMLSEKTFYNYVGRSLFSFRNIDLPRKVRYRPRKSRHDSFKCERSCRVGRTYGDFLSFVSENPDVPIVEMDTVEGRKGGKVLLTIHFTASKFMLAFIRDANTAQSVTDIFASLRSNLGNDLFMRLFPVLLTDNGSEFTAPREIETDCDGELTTRVFYCDPSRPDQKGAAENNHEMIRKILPKSTPLDNLSQQDVNKMMNHINSYARKILNDRTPFDAFRFFYGEDALKILGAELILPDDVTLRPSLFL